MKASIYIDKGRPVAASWPQTLSDGSTVWDIHFRPQPNATDHEIIHCVSEKACDAAMELMIQAITTATGERPFVL